jgi:rsbT co-antagonist protein RsbR
MGPTTEASDELLRDLFGAIALGAPVVISAFDMQGRFLLHVGRGLERLGLEPNQLRGVSVFEAFKGADEALRRIGAALGGEVSQNTQDLGSSIWDNWFGPLRDSEGRIVGAYSISTDVTERERAQAEVERRIAIIEAQAAALRRVAAPIIQVWQDVLVMPVIGELDEAQTAEMMDRLLAALHASRARHVILDLTGVERVDGRIADPLRRILRAAALLGVRGMISGIRPAVAEALVDIQVEASVTATLHDALRRCMANAR